MTGKLNGVQNHVGMKNDRLISDERLECMLVKNTNMGE
jgi:hypothetical protein